MDIETAKFLFQIAQFLMMCGIGFYVYMSNTDKVTNDRVTSVYEDLDAKYDGHTERLAKLEGGPTHADLAVLHGRISVVSNDVSQIMGELRGIHSLLGGIDRYLRKAGT